MSFHKTCLVSERFSTHWVWARDEGKEINGDLIFFNNDLNVFASAPIKKWQGRCLLGQQYRSLLRGFYIDQLSPACSANISDKLKISAIYWYIDIYNIRKQYDIYNILIYRYIQDWETICRRNQQETYFGEFAENSVMWTQIWRDTAKFLVIKHSLWKFSNKE